MMFKAYQSFKATSFSEGTSKLVKLRCGCIIFVAVQGINGYDCCLGLTMTSSQYGGFFYLIIGTGYSRDRGGDQFAKIALVEKGTLRLETFQAVQLFWFFVVGVWSIPTCWYLIGKNLSMKKLLDY